MYECWRLASLAYNNLHGIFVLQWCVFFIVLLLNCFELE